MTDTTFIIVGASLAGAKAAQELRERGFAGRVVLIGAEPDRPYERPPLSKEFVRGEQERDKAFVHDQGFYAEQQIELRTRTTVTSLDTAHSRLTLENGEVLDYDQLLLATGAEPRRIPVPGTELEGVHYLRTVEDSEVLRTRLAKGSGRVVVVGGGWIGSELAASARQSGLDDLLQQAPATQQLLDVAVVAQRPLGIVVAVLEQHKQDVGSGPVGGRLHRAPSPGSPERRRHFAADVGEDIARVRNPVPAGRHRVETTRSHEAGRRT